MNAKNWIAGKARDVAAAAVGFLLLLLVPGSAAGYLPPTNGTHGNPGDWSYQLADGGPDSHGWFGKDPTTCNPDSQGFCNCGPSLPQCVGFTDARLVQDFQGASVVTVAGQDYFDFTVRYEFPNLYCVWDGTPNRPPDSYFAQRMWFSSDPNGMNVIGPGSAVAWFEKGFWKPRLALDCTLQDFVYLTFEECDPITSQLVFRTLGPFPLPPRRTTNNVCRVKDPRDCPRSGAGPGSGVFGPVNVGSGDVRYSEPLFQVSGVNSMAPVLSLTLAYASSQSYAGYFGTSWSSAFTQTIESVPNTSSGILHVRNSANFDDYYTFDSASSSWKASLPAELRGTITTEAGATYVLTDLDGTATRFDIATGRWKSTKDRWGNAVTADYSGLPAFFKVSDDQSRFVKFNLTSGQVTSIQDSDLNTWTFTYASGYLTQILDPFTHGSGFWRKYDYVTLSGVSPNPLSTVKDDASKVLEGFGYDTLGRATSSFAEANRSFGTLAYAIPAAGQTTVTTQIDSIPTNQTAVFDLIYQGGRYLPTRINGNCSSCSGAGGDDQHFVFDASNHVTVWKVGSGAEEVETDLSYDPNGMTLTKTEAVGKTETRTTAFTYGYVSPAGLAWPRFVTAMSEPSAAKGVPNTKVTTYLWNTSGGSETTLTTQVSGFLTSADVAPTIYTTTTLLDSKHRVTEVDGPLPTARTTYAYYSLLDGTVNRRDRLQTQALYTLSLNHLDTGYDTYDIFGTAKTVTDPNLVQTTRVTDKKGRVTSITSKKPAGDPNEPADYTTSYLFDSRDRLTQVTLPLTNKVQYAYEDGTNRLLDTIRVDSAGNLKERLRITLNTIGNKTQEDYQLCIAVDCSTSTTKRTELYAYDSHDRLQKNTHNADSTHIDYTYDSRGNPTTVKDENHATANTTYAYDFLNRLTKATQTLTGATATGGSCSAVAGKIATCYSYDTHDNLKSVTDPNTNQTTYLYDDFRRVGSQTSPVSGTTTYFYDAAGNLTSTGDANGAVTLRVYDWASRPLSSRSSNAAGTSVEISTFAYDDPTAFKYGKGHLRAMTDPVATTTYSYERRGLDKQEVRTIPGNTYTTSYGFDKNGNRSTIGYPSGRTVTYTFDFADRPITLAGQANPAVTYVSAATYQPFGPLATATYGTTTLAKTITYDQRYRPTRIQLLKGATPQYDFFYTPDAVGNFTSICDASPCANPTLHAFDRQFAYDDLNRLTTSNSGSSLWGMAIDNKYAYDKMGNILSLKLGATRNVTFTYSGMTPKVATASDTTGSITYDAAGNETLVGTGNSFSYSPRNLLSKGEGLMYEYDGRGLRSDVYFLGPTVTQVAPASAAQKTTSYALALTITGTGFVSGATVQIAGLTVNSVVFNTSTSLTANVTIPAPSATLPSGLRDVIVVNPVTNLVGILSGPSSFDLMRFSDAPSTDPFSIYEWLATTKNPIILEGFTNNPDTTQKFNVATPILRRDMARWIERARLETAESPCVNPAFCDVLCSPLDPDWGWIERFFDDGITAGCGTAPCTPQPSYCPDATLTRAQMAVFIEKGLNQQEIAAAQCNPSQLRFADVLCTNPFWGWIEKFAQDGITAGCSPTTFCPDQTVSRGQMAVFISKGWQYAPPPVPDSLPGRYMFYTPEMNLLAETALVGSGTHNILYEYLWFNGEPVAQSDGATVTQQHWTLSDHLGTSLRQYDSSGNQYWRAEYEPYGRVFNLQTANQHEPLRLPGQEAEELNVSTDGNGSSKRFYNIFRWYRPTWGRYTQADPVDLDGGSNLFAYVFDNPTGYIDSTGLTCSTNWNFFWDWALEHGSESRQYDPGDVAGGEMSRSRPAVYMRRKFTEGGCRNLTNQGYSTPRAFFETFYRPCDTSFQVGGFIWGATNVGGCQVKYHVDNTASLKSLLYHIPGVPRKPRGKGIPIGGNIMQTFEWTEKNPCLCCPENK